VRAFQRCCCSPEIGLRALWVWARVAVVTYPFGGPNVQYQLRPDLDPRVAGTAVHSPATCAVRRASQLGGCSPRLPCWSGPRHPMAPDPGLERRLCVRHPRVDRLDVLPLSLSRRSPPWVRRPAPNGRSGSRFTLMLAGLLLALSVSASVCSDSTSHPRSRGRRSSTTRRSMLSGSSGPYEAPEPYGLALVLCLAADPVLAARPSAALGM